MTEREPAARPRRRRDGLARVLTASVATFLALLAFLAVQMREGKDPALGPRNVAAIQAPPRHVTVRRVIENRVVVERDDGEGGDDGSSTSSGAPAPTVVSAPSAPAAATPAPAPTTRSS